VTGRRRRQGLDRAFHVTANPAWSTLAAVPDS